MLRSTELVGRVIGGRYRLSRPIGSGASAHVYVAEDVRLRRRVAVKVLHPALAQDRSFLRRFQAEAQTVAALRHRSILRVYDWGEDDGEAYLVMELLEGGSLRALLDTGQRLSTSQVAAMGLDVASALAHAHSRGLVHRDIKPANLLFDDEGHVSVADFGIARALAEASWTEPWGAMVGTARYAAPEQLRAVPLDGKADVYALAMVMVEAVTGSVPFSLDTTLGALIARADQSLPVPAEMGVLVPVLEQAGLARPEERLTAERTAHAIARVATGLRAPTPLALPGLGHLNLGTPLADRTEMGSRPVVPGDGGLTVMASDLPPVIVPPVIVPPVIVDGAPPADKPLGAEAPSTGPVDLGAGGEDATELIAGMPAINEVPLAAAVPVTGAVPVVAAVPVAKPLSVAKPLPVATAVRVAPQGPIDAPVPTRRGRRRRRRWLVALLVLVVVALLGGGGAAAYVVLTKPPPTYAVPALRGEPVSAAGSALSRHHLRLVVGFREWDAAPSGRVISQQPKPGARLKAKQTVVVTLSRGPQPVVVPSLATLDLAQATSALKAAGLALGKKTSHTSMTVQPGIVISWSSRGQDLLPGTHVNVVISSGKPMVSVPAIGPATATWSLMSAALTHAGLVAHEATTYSNSVTAGDVISTNPAEGASEVVGTGVTVTVSAGPHMVTIPTSVIGQPVTQAATTLQNVGLYASGSVEGVGGLLAPVIATNPAAGTSVRYQSTIILITGWRR